MNKASDEALRLRTERLELRPLRVEDAEEMVPVLGEAALYAFTGGAPPDVASLRERYVRQVRGPAPDAPDRQARWINWIARLGTQAVGYVQASIAEDDGGREVAQVAWVIGVPWQRRGLAAEAAGALVAWLRAAGVSVIEANIAVGHAASQAVAARIGLRRTARRVDGEEVWSSAPVSASR